MNRYTLYDGSGTPAAEPMALRAGPLSMLLDPQSGMLRYVRVGSTEILRGIYVAVRDQNWGTVPAKLSDLRAQPTRDGGFEVSFNVACRRDAIDFVWQGRITGEPSGRVVYTMAGSARSSFQTARTGICVLHPASAAGAQTIVTHPAGGETRGRLPELISPHQPFRDIAAVSHEFAPQAWCDLAFGGEVFEMEDQRNWTDASYKTYCRPLSRPRPYPLQAGEQVRQSVTLSLRGPVPQVAPAPPETPIEVKLDDSQPIPMPPVGLCMSSDAEPLTPRQVTLLKRLRPSHLRVDLSMTDGRCIRRFTEALDLAMAIDAALEVAVLVGDDVRGDLHRLTHLLEQLTPLSGLLVSRILLLPQRGPATTPEMIDAARAELGGLRIPLVGGTNSYFAQLNRNPPPTEGLSALCFSMNPQVHAFDNTSLVETLAGQAMAVRSALALAAGIGVVVSPVTLRPRHNPDAIAPESQAAGELPGDVDVRQMSLLGAAWTLGSLKNLIEAGASSISTYETVGWRGVMERQAGPPLPARFGSIPGGVFPLYHVLADVCEFAGGTAAPATSTDPLAVQALSLAAGDRRRLLVCNLTHRRQVAHLRIPAGSVRVRRLDETTAEQAMSEPEAFESAEPQVATATAAGLEVELAPYAVLRLDR